jgi:hypothetical protein
MIHSATKKKLLTELEKNGNVSIACMKAGVNRATYYRWRQENKEFMKRSNQALKQGRENNCDIAEHALMLKVKDQDISAIKYLLNNNSPRYKRKQNSNVVIVHRKELPNIINNTPRTLEDLFDEHAEKVHDHGLRLYKDLTMFGGEIPKKPNGAEITIDELPSYETYIRDWQRVRREEKSAKIFKETGQMPCY